MGAITFGIPEKEAVFLKDLLKLSVFVETGTYRGGTALKMSKYFRRIYTIEKSEKLYKYCQKKLNKVSNITTIFGDSRDILPGILEKEDNILFWLDAHWSGGETYGEKDECPLLYELNIIQRYYKTKNYAVLIDDARYFLAPPPYPHNFKHWPTIIDVLKLVPTEFQEVIIYNDVIYIFPKRYSNYFRQFLQSIITHEITKRKNIFSYLKLMIKKLLYKIGYDKL